jgi:type-F conjugative transfer system pilin assembly protein TrbC
MSMNAARPSRDVKRLGPSMNRWVVTVLLALSGVVPPALARAQSEAPSAGAQPGDDHTMASAIRAGWSTYIFVSSTMPRESLVALAREASLSGAVLVLRGFGPGARTAGEPVNLGELQKNIAELDAECCKGRRVGWIVDPKLFDRYHVAAVPSFCLAWGEGNGPEDYSLIAGDMLLSNALKFMAQESSLSGIRKRAASLYQSSFEGRS